MPREFCALDLAACVLTAEEIEMLHTLSQKPMRRTYSILSIALRHPKLFSKLVGKYKYAI